MKERFDQRTLILIAVMVGFTIYNRLVYSSGSFMDWVMQEILMLPGIIIALSFHEFGHAWVADKLGDPTAKNLGRVTINPAAHIDPLGFVMLFLAGFGWGIPVPVNDRNFKNPRRDGILVSCAGVAMNLLLAVAFTLILKLWVSFAGYSAGNDLSGIVQQVLVYVVFINIVLMIFNLLPVPPLDGFLIFTDLFHLERYSWWEVVYRNGFFILLLLIIFNVTDLVMTLMIRAIFDLLMNLAY